MIRHCVFLNLRTDHDATELRAPLRGLSKLCDRLEGAHNFFAGPNRDFELKSQAFEAGFTVDFDDAQALQAYAENPEHQALGGRLVVQCTGGAEGIMVFDLEVEGP